MLSTIGSTSSTTHIHSGKPSDEDQPDRTRNKIALSMRLSILYKRILFVLAPMLCILCASCTDDIDLKLDQQKWGFTPVGDPVQVYVKVSVADYAIDNTRAEEPTYENVEDTEEESHVDDLWFFEYDSSSGNLVGTPTRVKITEQSELDDVQVTLYDNDGSPVTVYVVANAGSGVDEDSENWVGSSPYTGFSTKDELEAKAIPTPHPQRMLWDETEEKYVIHPDDASVIGSICIPMSGSKENVTIREGRGFTVYVDRMFAKLLARVDLSDFDTEDYESAWLNTLTVGNIPEYCRVGTLWDGDTGDTAQPGDYKDCEQWLQRRFNAAGESSNDTSSGTGSGNDDNAVYPYLIYVPENIQGENKVDGYTDKADNVPDSRALSVIAGIYVKTNDGGTIGEYTNFIAYPGGNETTNFNVRRNCIYRVTLKINNLIDDVLPSANCIICPSGEATVFYPYCRTETGGGYDFTDYLDADDDTGAKKIDHVGIIWQSTDGGNIVDYDDTATGYIGDNSKNDYVWIDKLEDVKNEYHRRIHVSIPSGKTGNALVGAYNSDDEIIWSWHIWSRERENDPTTVNTKLYYTYEWDSEQIYGYYSERPRVAGYTIMNCNIGAMQDEPASSSSYLNFNRPLPTFGTLYQWGRKDPFPPITTQLAETAYGGNGTVVATYSTKQVGNYFDNENEAVAIVNTNTTEALFHSVPGTDRKSFETMIPLTIKNPTVFYAGTTDVNLVQSLQSNLFNYTPEPYDANWLLDDENEHYNSLWGGLDPEHDQVTKTFDTGYKCTIGRKNNAIHLYDDYGEKSIFDPCPYGWRVSPPDLWLGFTYTGLNPSSLNDVNYNTDRTISRYAGMAMYLTAWREGETSFFPIQGTREPDGSAYRAGQCGNYNNATADANSRVNTLHIHYNDNLFHIFEYSQQPYYVKSTAGPLRCVRIDSVQQ